MKPVSPKLFWQTFIGVSILLAIPVIFQTSRQISALGINLWHSKWAVLIVLFGANIIIGIFLLRQLYFDKYLNWVEWLEFSQTNTPAKVLGFVLVIVGFSFVWIAKLFLFGSLLSQLMPILWVFFWASLIQSFGLKLISGYKWHSLFALIVLIQGVIYQAYGHFAFVTEYPFSIGYSEAGRYYYASLFFAKSLYGLKLPLPFLHPTRYFLMSLPFLFDGLPFWAHRLWQSILWVGLTGASSVLLARRLSLKGWMQFYVAAWAFLYFFQGAVYYHLHICIILILAGVSVKHPKRSLIFVILASVWAGVSRVNWFPVPAMLAIAIYVLETPFENRGWRYWLTPFAWGGSGLVAAIVSQFIYINISGNADIRTFGSSFTSDLLWNRLFPNETFSMGILLGITLISIPLMIAIIQMARSMTYSLHPLRWVALLGMLFILFCGGLIVSVKIGGGGDLHNMDAFLVLLALIAASFFAGRVVAEDGLNSASAQIHWSVIVAVLLVPIGFALSQIGYFFSYDHIAVENDIKKLDQIVSNSTGEVLFITERQLLTFKEIGNIPLVSEYEQSELMEMAMSGNREYLENFYSDLKKHRFAMIVAEKQKRARKKEGPFVEEDNAWVQYVGSPLLCNYQPVESLLSINIQVFVPRSDVPNCKDPFEK